MKKDDEMKTLLCCIGRKENRYIREFVEYYKEIGFTHICLYDNNYEGEEHFEDVIGDYVDEEYVTLVDYRGQTSCQMRAYNECYIKYGNEYDWIAFFDCDEFLTFATTEIKTISQALSDKRFDGFNMIYVNWKVYGDNGMVEDDGRPVLERFVVPLKPFDKIMPETNVKINSYVKPIVRGGLKRVFFNSPHTPKTMDKCCNPSGKEVAVVRTTDEIDYSYMYLRHFMTKTINEYIHKLKRGYPDLPPPDEKHIKSVYEKGARTIFFFVNKATPEKIKIIKECIGIDLVCLLT